MRSEVFPQSARDEDPLALSLHLPSHSKQQRPLQPPPLRGRDPGHNLPLAPNQKETEHSGHRSNKGKDRGLVPQLT